MKEIKVSGLVYSKDFQIKALGYSCEEVDLFLDDVNLQIVRLEREYESLSEKYRMLEAQKSILEKQNKELQLQLYNNKAQNSVNSSSTANFSNIDLLNRVSNLEKMVRQILESVNDKSNDGRF